MSRPSIQKNKLRKGIGITLSPAAMKLGLQHARKNGTSFSEVVNQQLLKLKP